MKVVVIGGSGLIGKKLVNNLNQLGHEAVAASPSSGVNTLTGEGLAEVLKGADAVVDVSNSPSWEDAAVLEFFETSTRNLLAAEAAAGVRHHVALSVVGAVRLPPALMQPIVSDDVAAALARVAVAEPLTRMVELAGPEPIRQDELVRRYLAANKDPRKVITDVKARYYGTELNDQSLAPGENPMLGTMRFDDWLSRSVAHG